ncbi:MAG: glycosyltransferase [Anaerolineaceae bacterium]|nr:glycosyltransferase [Anaerolineaceae bacterium]
MRLTHVITDLDTGGAEMMLFNMLPGLMRDGINTQVISLTGLGIIADKIRSLGVPVRALGMKAGLPDPGGIARLIGWLREDPPDIIQTWMYHSDLVGGLAGKFAGNIPVIWGIHNSTLDAKLSKRSTIWTVRVCSILSHSLPGQIITCSETARKIHVAMGYAENKIVVIPNGFLLDDFHPDMNSRESLREELGLEKNALMIGLIARFNPQKDHQNFIKAAGLVLEKFPSMQFLLCGDGVCRENLELARWIEATAKAKNFHLLGLRSDIPRLTAALDLAVSSSAYGEAFPLVIGEAMACAVPCVVTNVGDSPDIVGDSGRVVPARDSQALAAEIINLLNISPAERSQLGQMARARIEDQFDIRVIVSRYEQLYKNALNKSIKKDGKFNS